MARSFGQTDKVLLENYLQGKVREVYGDNAIRLQPAPLPHDSGTAFEFNIGRDDVDKLRELAATLSPVIDTPAAAPNHGLASSVSVGNSDGVVTITIGGQLVGAIAAIRKNDPQGMAAAAAQGIAD